ncbi:orotate phosphoribosyltransferase [Olsenella massiliensis]|uniref:orotate phosphoribosyltransferase n=1 Tax=Olsenella massiliensis TaxID=1622075 RepID=UPI00071D3C7D|nr:orotate phosphoribosyltransferase [Olsenella massiliensis]
MASSQDIARALLSVRAVFLRPDEPFTWASGIKSPIYCDNRLTLSHPEVRTLIDEALAQVAKECHPTLQMLMGTSTAGIAHAAIAADRLGVPMGYVRGSAKDHGRKNQIEGRLERGERVVVVEDLISTGGSVLDCVEPLRTAGAEVLGVVSIFTYGMRRAAERLAAAQVTNHSLCDLDTLVDVAVAEGYLAAGDRPRLLAFRDDPADESWIRR